MRRAIAAFALCCVAGCSAIPGLGTAEIASKAASGALLGAVKGVCATVESVEGDVGTAFDLAGGVFGILKTIAKSALTVVAVDGIE